MLLPVLVQLSSSQIDIHWKLYELNGRFYRGRPKDGSMRTADIPPFLNALLARLDTATARKCTCRITPDDSGEIPWCTGGEYVFLGPKGGHLPGLTPHGLRHGHETWMDEAAIPYVLQSDRMGHEVPGMRGVYSHISATMRAALVTALETMWEASLGARAALSPRSAVKVLDDLLAPFREPGREQFRRLAPN